MVEGGALVEGIPTLMLMAGCVSLVFVGILLWSRNYTLDGIKDRTVGNGQHGTARWAPRYEIRKTYHHVPFTPELWRQDAREGRKPTANGKPLPQ